jgi:hypothetical protein
MFQDDLKTSIFFNRRFSREPLLKLKDYLAKNDFCIFIQPKIKNLVLSFTPKYTFVFSATRKYKFALPLT